MDFYKQLIERIGDENFRDFLEYADKEVARAKSFLLNNKNSKKLYFYPSYYNQFVELSWLLEERELRVAPSDIVYTLFNCKMLFAVRSKEEYLRAIGGTDYEEPRFFIPWDEKVGGFENVMSKYLDRLGDSIRDRTMVIRISSFIGDKKEVQEFFDHLFIDLKWPYSAYIDDVKIKELHGQELEYMGGEDRSKFFDSPSIGFTCFDSTYFFAYWSCLAYLRTFVNLLKIASFLAPESLSFCELELMVTPPKNPRFLGSEGDSFFHWDEDKKKPWEKIPDGDLWNSYGRRKILKTNFKNNFSHFSAFFAVNRELISMMRGHWAPFVREEIISVLDILSSVVQIQDLGAKVLLIYCCLEHLFVPNGRDAHNRKYIEGGINALNPALLEWFDRLYVFRCDYAHKGFIQNSEDVLALIFESIENVLELTNLKLRT